jgi:hypothetical protein
MMFVNLEELSKLVRATMAFPTHIVEGAGD